MNSTWNENGLVNGTGFTQSLTMANSNSPNIETTITWSWPNTPAGYNVYSYPAVFYGDYAGFNAPANNVTAEQINSLKTLTLSQNVSFSGQTDQYDGMYDGYTTSTPDGDSSTVQHEVEVYIHSPGYVQDWIQNLPQHHVTDSQGLQWTIATQGNIVIFAPSDFRDLTNYTTDLKGLLQAAVADGVMSGNEYFNGIALGNEPREGSGSMTIHSLSVNYDGDHTASAAAATQVASSACCHELTCGRRPGSCPAGCQPARGHQHPPPVTSTPSGTNSHSTAATVRTRRWFLQSMMERPWLFNTRISSTCGARLAWANGGGRCSQRRPPCPGKWSSRKPVTQPRERACKRLRRVPEISGSKSGSVCGIV